MTAHRMSVNVQALGCEALVFLVSSNLENRLILLLCNGPSIIIDTMRMHSSKYWIYLYLYYLGM